MIQKPTDFLLLTILCGVLAACTGCQSEQGKPAETAGGNVAEMVDTVVHSPMNTPGTFLELPDAKTVDPSWSDRNTVVYQVPGEPDNLHPTNGNSNLRFTIFRYTQKFVIRDDMARLTEFPGIVNALPEISKDHLRYAYQLRPGITWDNGELLSVDDIVFTVKANKCPLVNNPDGKSFFANLRDIEVIDQSSGTFMLHMKQPHIQNMSFLVDIPVMQRSFHDPDRVLDPFTVAQLDDPNFDASGAAELQAWANAFNDPANGNDPERLNGLGPYKVTAWEGGQRIELTRKAAYWTEKVGVGSIYEQAFPEKIILKVVTDANARKLQMKQQELDATTYIGARDLMELQEDPKFNNNYHSRYLANFGYTYLAMNMRPQLNGRKPFFTERRVRKAMALLAPVDDIIRVNYRNKVMRIAGPVSPMKYGCNRDLELITVDIPAAKALLDSAGWIDTDGDNLRDKLVDGERVPFVFELYYPNVSDGWRTIAEMMADGFYQAGVKAELKPVDPKLHWERATGHEFDMLLSAWAQGSSPDDHRQVWHTASWDGGSNYTGFGTPATDALIDSINTTLDPARRASLNQRFQRIVYEEHPYIFICASSRKIVLHKRFRNANMYYEKPNLVLNNFLLATPAAGQSQSSLAE